jgi:flagellar motility protein MotE (MotC chaperone)
MSRLSPRPRQRPRPALRRAALAPALLATIGILAGAKIVLLAQEALGTLAASSVHEARVLTAEQTAPAEVEPGAGPREPVPAGRTAESQPDDPAPQAEATPATAGPARRLALDRLSQGEIEVLHQLAERRAALERREQQLDRHAALLATAEADLVKIYETMKPKAAAEIFNRLEMPILIRVIERMRAPKSVDVLARMEPAKAKQVTAELARRTELLRAAGDG